MFILELSFEQTKPQSALLSEYYITDTRDSTGECLTPGVKIRLCDVLIQVKDYCNGGSHIDD